MSDPFAVLGLDPHADEEAVRRRYLELVRESPPDRDPERFAAIREAYDRVRDPSLRLYRQIFEIKAGDSVEALAADLRGRIRRARVPLDLLPTLAGLP